jgi:hypothetical protein
MSVGSMHSLQIDDGVSLHIHYFHIWLIFISRILEY